MDAEKTMLNWEYCECGCQCHVVMVGRTQYSIYMDAKDSYRLTIGHGWLGYCLGTFSSMEAADKAAREHAAPEFKLMRENIEKLAPVFKDA